LALPHPRHRSPDLHPPAPGPVAARSLRAVLPCPVADGRGLLPARSSLHRIGPARALPAPGALPARTAQEEAEWCHWPPPHGASIRPVRDATPPGMRRLPARCQGSGLLDRPVLPPPVHLPRHACHPAGCAGSFGPAAPV